MKPQPFFRFLPKKDPTAKERMRRHRKNKREAAMAAPAASSQTIMIAKAEMRGFAVSLVRGEAGRLEMLMAAALILRLMRDTPETGEVRVSLAR